MIENQNYETKSKRPSRPKRKKQNTKRKSTEYEVFEAAVKGSYEFINPEGRGVGRFRCLEVGEKISIPKGWDLNFIHPIPNTTGQSFINIYMPKVWA